MRTKLFYVAISRATQSLTFTSSERRWRLPVPFIESHRSLVSSAKANLYDPPRPSQPQKLGVRGSNSLQTRLLRHSSPPPS